MTYFPLMPTERGGACVVMSAGACPASVVNQMGHPGNARGARSRCLL